VRQKAARNFLGCCPVGQNPSSSPALRILRKQAGSQEGRIQDRAFFLERLTRPPPRQLGAHLTATSRTPPWPAAGWECRGRRLSRGRRGPGKRRGLRQCHPKGVSARQTGALGDECGTEAYEARAVSTPDAWIYDSGRSRSQQFPGRPLRVDVAVRVQTLGIVGIAADVVEVRTKIC